MFISLESGPSRARRRVSAFLRDTAGSASGWGLVWLIGLLAMAGIAVDSSNAWRIRAILQSSADAAAHAGAIGLIDSTLPERMLAEHPELGQIDQDDPKDVARALARLNMATEIHGEVLRREGVTLGRWHVDQNRFIPDDVTPDAVKVNLHRSQFNDNSLPTDILRIIGFSTWNIDVVSIARIYKDERGECIDPLLAAQLRVDVQTNDVYVGVCVYADADVSVGTQEPWLSDEVVGLVDRVVLSAATGIDVATLDANLLALIADGLGSPLSTASFSGLVSDLRASADVLLTVEQFKNIDLVAGTTYYVSCADNQTLNLPAALNMAGVVLLSECPIRAAQDLSLKTSVVIANLKALKTITLSLSLGSLLPPAPQLFGNEPCVPGDGVQILVFVDFDTAARFTLFSPELFPLGEALVSAHRNDTEVDANAMTHLGVTAEGNILTNAGLDNLLGLCVATQFLLNADAVTLSQ